MEAIIHKNDMTYLFLHIITKRSGSELFARYREKKSFGQKSTLAPFHVLRNKLTLL